MEFETGPAGILVSAAIALFWIGMLGLLWRRSLVGMLLGLLFSWVSVALAAIGFTTLQGDGPAAAAGGGLVICVSVLCCMQLATGVSIVVARIRRRGTLDADDAGLLEG